MDVSSESLRHTALLIIMFLHQYHEILRILGFHDILNAEPNYETEQNRDPVLQDQTVLPEIPNQPLVHSDVFSYPL